LLGQHQRLNAALAIATIRTLKDKIPIIEDAVVAGLSRVRWPGRLQLITRPSGRRVLLDGAHNVAGAQALRTALKEYFHTLKPALVLGILRDKNWSGMCDELAPIAGRIWLVPVSSDRAAVPEQLQQACRKANPAVEAIVCKSLAEALEASTDEPFVLVTGSLYLAGEALELLRLSTEHNPGERALNEWSKV
jgi:dihydrofolate synthase/folylpolyglutamate synthase